MTTLPPGRALQVAAGIIPATLIVWFAGLIALIALALDTGRRQYALDLADRFVDLASVLVGATRPRRPQVLQAAKPHRLTPPQARPALPSDNNYPLPDPGQPPAQHASATPVAAVHDIIGFMARRGRSGTSDPGLAGTDGGRRGRRARVPGAGRTVFGFGLACLVLGAMAVRLVLLIAGAHPEFGRAWLPTISAGCAVSVGWAGVYAAAIWRFPGRRCVQWTGYAYALATIVLMAPFFPRSPGTGYSFTTGLPAGAPLPLLDRLMLGALAFAAAGIAMAVLAVAFNRPLSRLESRRLSTWAAASSVLHVRARLREVGPAGHGPWRQGELRLAPGSVTWSMPRGRAAVDLTGARLLTAGFQARARAGRARTVLVLAAAGRFEVAVRPELLQEFITLADHFQPWRDQNAQPVDRGSAS